MPDAALKALIDLPLWVQLPVSALLVVGGLFALVGAVGMVRFPDFYMRLHAPTKASTLGVGGVLLASMALSWTRGEPGLHELLITLFVFVTAPVSANLMAMAALHLRVPSKAPVPSHLPHD
jgi:multicomponent K+:H+ antiporter subunit G